MLINIKRDCPPLVSIGYAPCARQQSETAREGERKEYDLQAQLVTSAWTRAMGLAALIGMIFGIIGIGLVYKTFEETRRSANAADVAASESSKAVAAALDANNLASETAKHQLRAYLHLGASTLTFTSDALSAKASVDIALKNTGQTPAKLLFYEYESKFWHKGAAVKIDGPNVTNWRKIANVKTNIRKIAGPNNEIDLSFAGSVPFSAIVGEEFEIVAELEWHYTDYLGRKWIETAELTTDRMRWDGRPIPVKLRQRRAESRRG